MQLHAISETLRVFLCIYGIASSLTLLQHDCKVLPRHSAAPYDFRSSPCAAIALNGITWSLPSISAGTTQSSAARCPCHDVRRMVVQSETISSDLAPPWTVLKAESGRDKRAMHSEACCGGTDDNLSAQWVASNSSTLGCRYISPPLVQTKPPAVTLLRIKMTQLSVNIAYFRCCDSSTCNSAPVSLLQTVMQPATAFATSQSLSKDRLQLLTTWVHISGFTGDSEQMHAQLQLFQEQYTLPLSADAHHLLDIEAGQETDAARGHALSGQVLSTHSKRSILFPLQDEAIFAINSECAATHGALEQEVYPTRLVSSLPAPMGHHGRMPTLIAQPWFVDPAADLQLVSRLFGFAPVHRSCLEDIYATCMLCIQTAFQRHECDGMRYVQLLWHAPAVAIKESTGKQGKSGATQKAYPPTLYVYLVTSPEINLHTMIVREALPIQSGGYQLLDSYPCLQLTTRVPMAAGHLQRKYPDISCWLLLVDVRDVPLCYVHRLLTSLGISPYAITGLAYTTNGGQYMDALPQATNILVQLNSQHVLDRLAERWYPDEATNCINNGTIVTAQRSPRVTKAMVGRIQAPLVRTLPLPTLQAYKDEVDGPLYSHHNVNFDRLPMMARYSTHSAPALPPNAFPSAMAHTGPAPRTTSPKRASLNTSERTGKVPRTDEGSDEAMEVDAPTADLSAITLINDARPGHSVALLARLHASVEQVMAYDSTNGILALRSLLAHYVRVQPTRSTAGTSQESAAARGDAKLTGTGYGMTDCTDSTIQLMQQERTRDHTLMPNASDTAQHPYVHADWLATPGDGLCGYHAFASGLQARGILNSGNLVEFFRRVPLQYASSALRAKLDITLQHLVTNPCTAVPSSCWCSVAGIMELAQLFSVSATVWISEHYLDRKSSTLLPPMLHAYRSYSAVGPSMHIALHKHHFYHMQSSPACSVHSVILPTVALDSSIGCGVIPQRICSDQLRAQLEQISQETGGMLEVKSTAAVLQAADPTGKEQVLRVPAHTITTAETQHWADLGALVRLLLHDVPPRPIAVVRNTTATWKAALHMVLAELPAGGMNTTIKRTIARVANQAVPSESLLHPMSPVLSLHDLLHVANHLSLPVVFWRADKSGAERTFHRCLLHVCSATATHVPWDIVQHVVHVNDLLVRVEHPVEATPTLLEHLAQYVAGYESLYPPARLHCLPSHLAQTLAAQHHFLQRAPNAATHIILPAIPFPPAMQTGRPLRQSQRAGAAGHKYANLSPILRVLPLPSSLLAHHDLYECDPKVVQHYWQHRDYNRYVHVVYVDHVAGRGAAGLCASTHIPQHTLIAPYVGITKSRRHSSVYTAETAHGRIDAAAVLHDYGYQLFSSGAQSHAPHNVARFANSLRSDQLDTNSFNSRLGDSPVCAGFDTIWLIATRHIHPGEEILCDYGGGYLMPSTAPPLPTPPTQSSQGSDVLSYTSTGTLIDADTGSPPPLWKRMRLRVCPTSQPSQSTQRSCASALSLVDLTTEYDCTAIDLSSSQHEVHLHPAGAEYSSDEAGDGPDADERCQQLLHRHFRALRRHADDISAPPLDLSTMSIQTDLTPTAVTLLHMVATARGAALHMSELQCILDREYAVTLAQQLPDRSFSNTQGRGYCGYLIILQVALAHHYNWYASPDLTDMMWRRALSALLALIPQSSCTVSVAMEPELRLLLDKLLYICPRLSGSTYDGGTLQRCYWLSSDEVICALTLLQLPCTLWLQHTMIRAPRGSTGMHLSLAQASPECQLACTQYCTHDLSQLLTRTQIGYAHSHFFLLRPGLQHDVAARVVRQFYARCSALTLDQLGWLAKHDYSEAPISSNAQPVLHAPVPVHTAAEQASAISSPRPVCSEQHPCETQQPPSLRAQAASNGQDSHSDVANDVSVMPRRTEELSPYPAVQAAARPSGRRKHKRLARRTVQHRIDCDTQLLFTNASSDTSCGQQLTIAYWNANGHLVGGSVEVLCGLIQHLSIDVFVLIDTRLSRRAGEYHAAAIKHFIPGSSVVLHSTTRHSSGRAGGKRMQTMGGAMYIIAPRCAVALRDSKPDASALGVAGYIKLSFAGIMYCIYHAYIPPPPSSADGAATLNRRLRSFLDAAGRTISPQDYILSRLQAWITAARSQDVRIIVGGDFNLDPALANGTALQQWAEAVALQHAVALLHPTASLHTHMVGGVPRTRLDHVYVDMHSAPDLRNANVVYEPVTAALSDHCPIYVRLHCPGIAFTARPPAQPPPPPRLELPHHNLHLVEQYQSVLSSWTQRHASDLGDLTAGTAATLLGALMGATTDAAAQVTASRRHFQQLIGHRSRFKDGFSPLYCALKSALLLLLRLQCDLYRSRQRSSSVTALVPPRDTFIAAVNQWHQQNPPSQFPDTQRSTLAKAGDILALHVTVFLRHDAIASRIADLRRLLHGRRRTEWRRQHSERIALLEDMRVAHKYRLLFRRIGIKDAVTLDLDTLADGDNLLVDPRTIHCALTRHFTAWYCTPADTHSFAQQLNNPAWTAALLDGTACCNADLPPTFRQQQFIDACRMRASATQCHRIQQVVDAPLTMAEYLVEVHLLCYGKAPGPSGVTSTMIKAWPNDTHVLVFHCLQTLWAQRSVPQWWLHSYLHPIPKKGAITIDNLRPLGLYEITRKILAAIIIKRAYRTWEHLHLLHPNQHAYRRGVGTSTAILRLLNLVEDATESNHQLYVTAWDIKRAFDSIPHSFIRLALLRLGVSADTASWFQYMLQHNVVTVRSPYVQRNATSTFPADPARFNDSSHDASISFHQDRGIGQGDTPSAILWVALYDILLCMLDTPATSTSGHFLARGPLCNVYAASSISYADDLCTPAGTLQLSQYHADIVSTFCAATTLLIAAQKVLAFALNSSESYELVLRDWNWCPLPVPFCAAGVAMTYLGLDSSHHLGDASALIATSTVIRASTTALCSRSASSRCKHDVVCMQLYPKVLYPASKACWNLQEFRKLDSIVAALLRHISRYMHSTATDMLYFPVTHGGTGQHKISDLAQARKWSELRRALSSSGEVALAAHGLLERGLRQMEHILPSSMYRQFPSTKQQFLKCFAGSLIEWGCDAGFSLSITPSAPFHAADAPITPYLDPGTHAHFLRILQQRDITAQGELCTRRRCDGTIRWINDTFTTTLRAALADKAIKLPASASLSFAAGQMFHIQPSDQYIEFYGLLANAPCTTLIVRSWNPVAATDRIGFHLDTTAPWLHLSLGELDGQHWTRLITAPARSPRHWAYRRILHRTCCEVPQLPYTARRSHHNSVEAFYQDVLLAQRMAGCTYSLFTDGSYAVPDLAPSAILESEVTRRCSGKATAAIVALGDPEHCKRQPLIVLHITADTTPLPGSNAYTAEVLALVLAVTVVHNLRADGGAMPTIHSDCKAAIATVSDANSPTPGKIDTQPTHILTDAIRNFRDTCISWVRSHPERRNSDTSTWSYTDWGIHLADMAAGGQPLSALHPAAPTLSHFIPYSAAVCALIPPATWHWSQAGTQRPLLCSLLPLVQQQRVSTYLTRRDQMWRDPSLPPRWVGTSLSHAARGWKLLGHSQRAFGTTILRHCLDKCWHGRNRAKSARTPAEATAALQCPHCAMPDDQMHSILHCQHAELADIRCTAHQQRIFCCRMVQSPATRLFSVWYTLYYTAVPITSIRI